MKILNYINGQLVPPISGQFMDNINPATEAVYSEVALSQSEDVLKAIQAAQDAFAQWSQTSFQERATILKKLVQLIEENFDSLVEAESIDTGKTISLAKNLDIPRSMENLNFFADFACEWNGQEEFPLIDRGYNLTENLPLGVVGVISPWNLPLYLFTWKIAPALMAGNTVIGKPSEVSPMSAFLFSKLCQKAGLPPGVLNIIHGKGIDIGPTLCGHPLVKAISFTGSTATGKSIAKICGEHLKKVSLEMGGKNPVIVFDDCSLEETVENVIRSSFSNQGQICLCGSRVLVQKIIYPQFKSLLVEKTQQLIMGNPQDQKTNIGPVVSKEHYQKILAALKLAKQEGAKFLTGYENFDSKFLDQTGFYIAPTILENLDYQSQTNCREIFGPVISLTSFEQTQEAVLMANHSDYGLSASIWTRDLKRARQVANQLAVGMVWINTWALRDLRTPFGGFKDSGFGREGGRYALEFFTQTRNIASPMPIEKLND